MKLNKALFAALVIAGIGSAHANFVSNGGFEAGNFTGWTLGGNTGFTGVTTGNYAHTGTYGAFLGPVGSDGTLSQTLTTIAGGTFQLSFWLLSDGGLPNDFSASINGNPAVFSQAGIPAQAYTEYSFSFVGTGSDTLTFAFRDDPGFFGLDDVSVVPEPASLALLGLGLAGLAFSRRRKA